MGIASRSEASAHLQSQLVESLTEIPGTPVLLMVLGVQRSRSLALVHGAFPGSGGSGTHVFRMLLCASLPRALFRLDEGRIVPPPRYSRRVSQNCLRLRIRLELLLTLKCTRIPASNFS